MSRQASPVVWGAVVDLEALVVKLQADCLLEHGLEGAVAAYDCLTTAIAGTRDRNPWSDSDPSRLRKATDGDPRGGSRSSFFPGHSLPDLNRENRRGISHGR
jgi:hypothetical protein